MLKGNESQPERNMPPIAKAGIISAKHYNVVLDCQSSYNVSIHEWILIKAND